MTEGKVNIYTAYFKGLNSRKLDAQSKLMAAVFGYDIKIVSEEDKHNSKESFVEMTFASQSDLTVDSIPLILEIRRENVSLEKNVRAQIR